MKIRTKAMAGLVIMAALLITANAVIVDHLRQEFSADQLQREQEIRLDRLRELQHSMRGLLTPLRNFVIYGRIAEEQRFLEADKAVSALIRTLRQEPDPLFEEETLRAVEIHLKELKARASEVFAARNLMASPEASRLTRGLGALSGKTVRLSRSLTQEPEQQQRAIHLERARLRNRLFTTILAAALLMIAGGLFGVLYFSKTVSRPLLRLLRVARQISEGDFSKRLDAGRSDEFGTVNSTFNYMLDTLEEREKALVRKNSESNRLIKELESSNEERQLANEEMESANEELQISNEELESTNEELNLSNQELETKTRELSEARELLEEKNEELKRAHDYLESIIQYTNSGICVIGRDHRIESVNRALEQITGYAESELVGSPCHEIFHGASELCPNCPTEQTFKKGSTARFHHSHLRKDGTEVILDITTAPLLGRDAQVEHVIETMNDVTEVTRLARALAEQNERIKSILMNMGEGVSVINSDYKIEFINEILKRRFGEIPGQTCFKAFRGLAEPCSGEPCSLQEVLVKGKKRFEVIKANEDGRYYRMTSVPLRNPDGTLSMIQIRQDVTAQKQFEKERRGYTEQLETMNRRMQEEVEKQTLELRDTNTELRLANERLKEMNREKSDFIDIAVHDLRTPLTSILSYAEILRKYHDEPHEKRAEFLEIIIKESFRMKDLIDDYLDLSKLEAGFVDFQEEEVDLPKILEQTFPAFESMAGAKKIRMSCTLPPSMPAITADANRIKQVFANLIDNAVKYTPEGGEIHVIGEVLEEQRMLRFTVQDSGIGMDQKDHGKLFHKFERIMDSEVRRQQGSGLGLSIVKTIVEHYGGTIQVRSRRKQGSSFTFTLPLERGVTQARHAIALRNNSSELVAEIGPLWKDCLERNYAAAYFGSPLDIEAIKETLSAQGLSPYDLMDSEQVILSPAREPLLKNGKCNGEHLYECARGFCERIIASPWEGLILVRDMSRLLSDHGSKQELVYFEKRIDRYLSKSRKPIIQICLYARDGFTELEISNLASIHPYRLEDGKIVAGSA